MALSIVGGPPRSGKSWFATERVAWPECIRKKRWRPIVTNLALNIAELNDAVSAELGYHIDLTNRIIFIGDNDTGDINELRYFYRQRAKVSPEGVVFPYITNAFDLSKDEFKKGMVPVFAQDKDDVGIQYILEEAMLVWDSQSWKEIGDPMKCYLAQHAKLTDDILIITQSIDNIAIQFRRLAQEFIWMTNETQRRFGRFRSGSKLSADFYAHVPKSDMEKPLYNIRMAMNPNRVGKWYATEKGVGVGGKYADTQKAAIGASPYWLLAGILCALAVVFFAPDYFIKKMFGSKPPPKPASPPVALATQSIPATAASIPTPTSTTTSPNRDLRSVSPKPTIPKGGWIERFRIVDNIHEFWLSDGSYLKNPEGAKWDPNTRTLQLANKSLWSVKEL